jgi:hypothetical protein
MPNHVTNILKLHGDEDKVRAMFETIKSDKIGIGSIDFNKVIPTPDNIHLFNTHDSGFCFHYYYQPFG